MWPRKLREGRAGPIGRFGVTLQRYRLFDEPVPAPGILGKMLRRSSKIAPCGR